MASHKPDTQNQAMRKAAFIFGNQTLMAKEFGVSQGYINQLVNGEPVPPRLCVEIEKRTRGEVTRAQLRPEYFGELNFDEA